MAAERTARLNKSKHRFEIDTDEGVALLAFQKRDHLLDLMHTEVPTHRQGQGYGNALVLAALEYARSEGLKIIPSCPFVRKWIEHHPQYQGLLA